MGQIHSRYLLRCVFTADDSCARVDACAGDVPPRENPKKFWPYLSLRQFKCSLVPAILEELNETLLIRRRTYNLSYKATDHADTLAASL